MHSDSGPGFWIEWAVGAGTLLLAVLGGWANTLIHYGRNAKRLDVVEGDVAGIERKLDQIPEIRVQVAEIHGWLKARNGFTSPRTGA